MAKGMFTKFTKVALVLACAFLMSATLPGCASTGKKASKCPNASAKKCGKDCQKPCCKKASAKAGKKGGCKGCPKKGAKKTAKGGCHGGVNQDAKTASKKTADKTGKPCCSKKDDRTKA